LQYMLAGVAAARECGVATYTAEQVIPSTAIMDGVTPPVVVGDASNLHSPPVLDLGGVWWIRYQPLDDSERGDLSWENPAVDTPIHMTFGNATHGMLRATSPDYQWLITKLDKDRWRRDTVFAADGPFGGARRMARPTRPTLTFTSYMGARQLRVHATDNVCLRRCGAWAPELTCQVPQLCDTWCELSGTWCA
ncbi:hypothetical protein EMIHUDRAFT_374530, partial [Emiliania huxleyi CCMP1516]|uniref:LNR domain-containing protein n=2 Tax=Emiliania huxleyi TaxID=2903 RepID=A0A0D3I428_EMIH1